MSAPEITILYGTETGNSRGLAQKVQAKADKNGVTAHVYDLKEYTVAELAAVEHPVLIIISTWDEGVPPPSARPFCKALEEAEIDLSGLKYTVLALGDTEYEQFCACGKAVDQRLKALGAECILERTDLGADFLVFYIGWSKRFWKTLAEFFGVAR